MGTEFKPQVTILTCGDFLGPRMARIAQTMSVIGIAYKVVNVNEMVPTGGFQILGFDEVAQLPELQEFCTKPSPKRRALLAQLERAKIRRDKNAIRDLTRQLEKV